MRVIDLLNKIANGEEVPNKFVYIDEDDCRYVFEKETDNDYWCEELGNHFFSNYCVQLILNDVIKIIEEQPKKEGFVSNNHRFVPNKDGVSIFPVEEYDFAKHFRSDEDIEEDKEIEEIEFDEIDEMTDYDIYFYPECSDDSKENFKNKINELIRNQKKIINELKKGK